MPRAAKRPRGPDPTAPPHGDDSDGEEGGGAVLLSPGKATGAGLVRQHNRQVKADAAAMAGPRAAWLDQHLDVRGRLVAWGCGCTVGEACGLPGSKAGEPVPARSPAAA